MVIKIHLVRSYLFPETISWVSLTLYFLRERCRKMQNMFAWQTKTAQWTRDAAIDASTADFRSVSASAWLKKVRTQAFHLVCLRRTSSSERCWCSHWGSKFTTVSFFQTFLFNGVYIYPKVTPRTLLILTSQKSMFLKSHCSIWEEDFQS